jgi:hypothetical protein
VLPATTATATATLPVTACCAPLAAPTLSNQEATATAALFKALADPHRVRIVNLLATSPDPVCVCELIALAAITDLHQLEGASR